MKRFILLALLLLSVNCLAVDNMIEGYDFNVATGLQSGATLNDLVTQSKMSPYAADPTNNFRFFFEDYFYMATNSGAGFTNYYLKIKPASLTSDLLTSGNAGTLGGNNVWSGTNTFTGTFLVTSNDMNESFHGYPKVALTTNMVTITATATPMSINSFTNAFDVSNVTTTDTATFGNSQNMTVDVDLGQDYQGYLRLSAQGSMGGSGGHDLSGWISTIRSDSGSDGTQDGGGGDNVGFFDWTTASATNQLSGAWYIEGRTLRLNLTASSAAGNSTLHINDWSFYGTTNGFRNKGGF